VRTSQWVSFGSERGSKDGENVRPNAGFSGKDLPVCWRKPSKSRIEKNRRQDPCKLIERVAWLGAAGKRGANRRHKGGVGVLVPHKSKWYGGKLEDTYRLQKIAEFQ